MLLLLACRWAPEEPAAGCAPQDEVPYDGIDQDCDGADLTDVDGDGQDALASKEDGGTRRAAQRAKPTIPLSYPPAFLPSWVP